MISIVFEHVKVEELPAEWRDKFVGTSGSAGTEKVTVRIEAEDAELEASLAKDPLYGMWQDREDMADVAAYVRSIREPRFNHDGTRRKT